MTEITSGIHWLKLPIPMLDITTDYVNAYLIEGDKGYLLVDSGWNTEETLHSLQKQLAEIGADIKDIAQILITHIHPDHYGLAGRLKRSSGAVITLHDIEKGFIDSRYVHMDGLLEETAQWLGINGVPLDELADIRNATMGLEHLVVPTEPDATLHGGETISTGRFTFQVLWTPGHSEGHICLYEPNKKILISGDHILPKITPHIGSHPQSLENTLGKYLHSLNDLRQLDAEIILPGHENPFTGLKTRIDELIKHHEGRKLEILATLKGTAKTTYQIAREITWGSGAGWQDMPFLHKRLAISETLAHLELMTINGQIARFPRDSIIYYQQT